ncbi:MAG: 1,2-dihydroxy-3-keto-5-methylthiopentene dioxygenase [Mariniblastus sp.]
MPVAVGEIDRDFFLRGKPMARVQIPEENCEIREPAEIKAFLKQYGIEFEQWDVEGRIGTDATNEEILEAYAPEIERLKQAHGFVTADVINVNPETPGLDEMLAKFDKEHLHTEDEVRFTVKGSGVFHINPESAPVFAVTVESGDLISVPKGTHHWFNLCSDKTIRCIRLFEDMSGWAPHYMEEPVHNQYSPMCMGPSYLEGEGGDLDPEKIVQF